MVACGYGVAFGAIQQMQDIVPGLAEVREQSAGKPRPAQAEIEQKTYNNYNKVQEIGGLVGRFVLAVLAVRIVSRRGLIRVFLVPALVVVPAVFYFFLNVPNHEFGSIDLSALRLGKLPVTTVSAGVFLAGLLTVAQFSFWGNYLPRVYPVHLRGTGESVAMNIGGRMVGTSFAALTSWLAAQEFIPGQGLPAKYATAAAAVSFGAILVGLITSAFLPEPPHDLED
jgi:hypothetical protein